jgi:hypothetical protein
MLNTVTMAAKPNCEGGEAVNVGGNSVVELQVQV